MTQSENIHNAPDILSQWGWVVIMICKNNHLARINGAITQAICVTLRKQIYFDWKETNKKNMKKREIKNFCQQSAIVSFTFHIHNANELTIYFVDEKNNFSSKLNGI